MGEIELKTTATDKGPGKRSRRGLKVSEAAELLQLNERRVPHLKGRATGQAVDWVNHGNRGRSPLIPISDETREAVVKLALGDTSRFNDSHLLEKLTAAEGMALSRQNGGRILRAAQIGSPQKRRVPKYRFRRDPQEREGLMQTDASRHHWLEGRRPPLTILGWIDDCHRQSICGSFSTET